MQGENAWEAFIRSEVLIRAARLQFEFLLEELACDVEVALFVRVLHRGAVFQRPFHSTGFVR
jgi:hypothetical protein